VRPARLAALLAVLLLLLARADARPSPRDFDQAIDVAGRSRAFRVHVPPGYGIDPLPLVIVFHGGGGNWQSAERQTGFTALADRENFIVVYPNGSGRLADRLLTWNACNCCGYALDRKIDDVAFLRAMVKSLRANFKIDADRIYATGISNGGMLCYRLACELSDVIVGIAPVAGAFNCEVCKPIRPVSVLAIHGTADQHVLYEGGKPKKRADRWHPRVDRSVSYAVRFWVAQDGCRPDPIRTENGDVIRDTWPDGRFGSEVALITIRGGAHSWPGGQRLNARLDPPYPGLNATEEIWRFFAAHPRRPSR